MINGIAALAACAFLVVAAGPAFADVKTLELAEPFYDRDGLLKLTGTEDEGKQAINVVIRGPTGKFVTLLTDSRSDADGSFETTAVVVKQYFTSSGVYNATAFLLEQKEQDGLSIELKYDGKRIYEVVDYTLELKPIPDKSIREGESVGFTASATDSSIRGLIFSLENAPRGTSIDESSGRFSWTPAEGQGHRTGTEYNFEVVVKNELFEARAPVSITVSAASSAAPSAGQDPAPARTVEPQPAKKAETEKPAIAPFVDRSRDTKYYIDRYNNEAAFREWFAENYSEYESIYDALGLDEPAKKAPFVDEDLDPQHYIDRYNTEPTYKKWFDENYPEYKSIYQAVGLAEPGDVRLSSSTSESGECGIGTTLVDGVCEITKKPDAGACLIATAAYGTELAPQVQLLREVRDHTLLSTESGTAFMSAFNTIYYTFSPGVADLERQSLEFAGAVRVMITPMLYSLSLMSLAEEGSEYQVIGMGTLVIALNLGMYVMAPAAIGIKIKNRLVR